MIPRILAHVVHSMLIEEQNAAVAEMGDRLATINMG